VRPANQDGPADGADAAGEEPRAALWLQPATGGDARVVANLPGGVQGVVVSDSGALVLGSPLLPSSPDADGDKVVEKPIAVPDFFATLVTELGMDPDKTFPTPVGRPISITEGGKVVREIIA